MGRDSRYFQDPNSFRPERWLRNCKTKQHQVQEPNAFLPFGVGVRSCIGRRVAEMQMQFLLARVCDVSHVKIEFRNLVLVLSLLFFLSLLCISLWFSFLWSRFALLPFFSPWPWLWFIDLDSLCYLLLLLLLLLLFLSSFFSVTSFETPFLPPLRFPLLLHFFSLLIHFHSTGCTKVSTDDWEGGGHQVKNDHDARGTNSTETHTTNK